MLTQLVEPRYATLSPYIDLTPSTEVPTPIGSIPSKTLTPEQATRYIHFGNILAGLLAIVLDQLKAYDTHAVYSIMSIIEPFREESKALDLDVPPESSEEDTDEQGESFFRFLDELETGAYVAGDIATEE